MFSGLLDTGADVSVATNKHWPLTVPLLALTELQGIGQAQGPLQSSKLLP